MYHQRFLLYIRGIPLPSYLQKKEYQIFNIAAAFALLVDHHQCNELVLLLSVDVLHLLAHI